jgi:hypothetical protein
MSLDKNISVHFVFTCPSNTSEFEASAWHITCSMIKFDTSGSCKILVSHLVPTVARRNTYACQVEPNAENCQVPWTQSVDSPVQLSPPCGVRSNPDKSCPHPCAYCKRNRSTRSNLPAIQ